jgi:hypothetical protein
MEFQMATNVVSTEAKAGHEHQVPVFVDNNQIFVTAGQISVSELKAKAGVSPAYELEEKVQGKLVPLADGAVVTVKGGEKFFSHPRDGASS